jgi:ArsR family metal-binding transcriptional regulator
LFIIAFRQLKTILFRRMYSIMWVITVYLKDRTTMFEFHTENEAREALKNIYDFKILTEVINYHYPSHALVAI